MKTFFKYAFKIITPFLVLAAGIYGAIWLIEHAPQAKRFEKKAMAILVQTMTAKQSDQQVIVQGGGNVMPAQRIDLRPEVSGQVINQSAELIPGGFFKKGDVIVRIDPRDYQYAVDQQKAKLESAVFALKQEEGQQYIAEREWKLLGKEVATTPAGRDLALRKPHLQYAKATLEAASSALKNARLNLERTTIRAPFNAMVLEENIDTGQYLTPQTTIATLIGTDQYWVQAAISVDDLPFLILPGTNGTPGSPVTVIREGSRDLHIEKEGHLIRLYGDVGQGGLMARSLIAIDDPLGFEVKEKQPAMVLSPEEIDGGQTETHELPLLIGDYVQVMIEGPIMKNIFVVPRKAIREGDRIWIMNEKNELEIRSIEIVWRYHDQNRDEVWIRRGLEDGDQIVMTRIGSPLPGMPLQLFDADTKSLAQSQSNQPGSSPIPAEQERSQ